MALSGLKKIAVKRKTRKFLLERDRIMPSEVNSVGILVDLDEFKSTDVLLQLKEVLQLEDLKIVGFSDFKKTEIAPEILHFNSKQIGISAALKDAELKIFAEKQWDLLINYTSRTNLTFNFLTAASKAKLKVGLKVENEDFYDLIIQTKIEDFEGFQKELIKYLKILKLLKNE